MTMDSTQLRTFLQRVRDREIGVGDALERLKTLPFEDLEFAKIDHHRSLRRGLPEVIFAQGKTPQQLVSIASAMAGNEEPVLISRLTQDVYDEIQVQLPTGQYDAEAKIYAVGLPQQPSSNRRVVVLSAGTSDHAVAMEALLTLKAFGLAPQLIQDVGVAGIHRLFAHMDQLQQADIVIVVAGMEGALPSVTAGLISAPVIAVPTSIGYGANLGGITALLSMINSCASGVTVVNIDNGFGAGFAAGLIARKMDS